jgi:tetratricopeptide (TPR) repeat protein
VSGFFRHLRRFRDSLAVALVAIGLLGFGSLSAQELSAAERAQLQAQKDALFQKSLRNPADLDTAFAYADAAAKLGDNEAAVSALERMLLFNPNLPRVQLELGALYFRMGSYDSARTYFERAAAAIPPDDVKERIRTYIAEISRRNAPQRFSAFAFFGAQYQSDANLAGSSSITALSPFGAFNVNLQPQFVKRHDFIAFGTGSALYSYDLGNQDADTFEIGATGYVNHYGTIERLNLGFIEATAGPRFNFRAPLPGVVSGSLKPYAIVNEVTLGGHQYFNTAGLGGESTALVWEDVRFKSAVEFRQKRFANAPDRPQSTGFDGNDTVVSLFAAKPITIVPDSELSVEFDFLDQDTRFPSFANKSYAGAAAYRVRYDDPSGYFRRPLETNFSLSRTWADYAAPDLCGCGGSPTSNRFDRRWRFAVAQTFPITEDIAVVMQAQRDIVSSNVPLYHYTSNSVLVGSQIRF